MQVEVYEVSVSFDADRTNLDAVLSGLSALMEYAQESKLGYDELETVEVER